MTLGSMFDHRETWDLIRRRAEEVAAENLSGFRAAPAEKPAPVSGADPGDLVRRNGGLYLRGELVHEYELPSIHWNHDVNTMRSVPVVPSGWAPVLKGVWRHHSGVLVTPVPSRAMVDGGLSVHPDSAPDA